MIHFKSKALQRWVVLIVVSLVGGMITKLPYLKDIYFSTLQAATGTTKTQLGLLLTMYGLMNFICYFPGGMLADKISPKKLIVFFLFWYRCRWSLVCNTARIYFIVDYSCFVWNYYSFHILGFYGKNHKQSG